MISVADLVEDLGGAVLRVMAAPSDMRAPIGRVTLLDPSEPAELGRGDLVIGIGVVPGSSADRLLSQLAAAGPRQRTRKSTSSISGSRPTAATRRTPNSTSAPRSARPRSSSAST